MKMERESIDKSHYTTQTPKAVPTDHCRASSEFQRCAFSYCNDRDNNEDREGSWRQRLGVKKSKLIQNEEKTKMKKSYSSERRSESAAKVSCNIRSSPC